MHIALFFSALLPATRRCVLVLWTTVGGVALAQTVLPAISTGISPARGSSITNLVIPSAAGAAGAAAGTNTTGASNPLNSALQPTVTGPDGVDGADASQVKAAKGPQKLGLKGQAKADADAQSKANDPSTRDAKASAEDASNETVSEAIKKALADETEFQRFVFSATGVALRLYGYELFQKGKDFAPVQAAPVPAGYVLGPGDEIVVQVNGLVDISSSFTIDRDGRIMVPKVGPLSLAGVPFIDTEKVIAAHIAKVYRNFTVSVTMGQLRSIEVFVLGQARKPGKHVVSSLSGVVNALLETGGPSSNGSLRAIELRRGGKTIATVDLYAFLSNGDNSADARLMSGDVIYIPPAGARAALLGTINAPAIYELRPGETIAQVLALSGGLPTLAAPQKAQLERVDANRDIPRYVEDFALDAQGQKLALKGGDILTVFQISPQIANAVTLEGNVAAPLRYTFRPGMRISDLLLDKRLLIPSSYWLQVNRGSTAGSYARPEVNIDYATVQRLNSDTLQTEILAFDLSKAMAQDPRENLELRSGDIVKVYAPDDPGPVTENSISITGESVGGTHRFAWREGNTIANYASRINELFAQASRTRAVDAQVEAEQVLYSSYPINLGYATVLRRDPDSLRATRIAFNLGKALSGDRTEAIALKSRDSIAIYAPKQLGPETLDAVTISGEVVGGTQRYVWREGFTVRDIIPSTQWLVDTYNYWQRASGRSLNNDINWDYAQVIRRVPATLQSKAITFNLGRAVLQGLPADNIRLEPGDQIALFTTTQLPVPSEKRAQVATLSGEVMVPGKYQLEPGETLPELIKRAGGLSKQAFVYGTVFTRESTRMRQEESISKAKQRLQAQADTQANTVAQNTTDPTKIAALQAQAESQKQLLKRVDGLKAIGRIALDLDAANPVMPPLVLEDGDSVTFPTRPNFVSVFGEVYTESAFIHKPGLTVGDYLEKAGATRDADIDNLVLVRADGTVEGSTSRLALWSTGINSKKLNPGDSLFVPALVDRRSAYSLFIDGAKDWTSLLYQFALGAAAFKTLRN